MLEPAKHPGEMLVHTLTVMDLSQAELARQTRLSAKHINQICKGVAGISAATAVVLEEETGVAAELWLRLQGAYDLAVAREVRRDWLEAQRSRQAAAKAAAVELTREALGATDE